MNVSPLFGCLLSIGALVVAGTWLVLLLTSILSRPRRSASNAPMISSTLRTHARASELRTAQAPAQTMRALERSLIVASILLFLFVGLYLVGTGVTSFK